MPTYTQLFQDTFHRANEAPLNPANWTNVVVAAGSELEVASNVCVGDATAALGYEVYTGASVPADQYVEATIGSYSNTFQTNGSTVDISCRGSSASITLGYFLSLFNNGVSNIFQVLAGSTPLFAVAIGTVSPGDVLRIEIQGTTLIAKYNGVVKFTGTDNTYASGMPGLFVGWDAAQADTSVTLFTTGKIISSGSGSGPDTRVVEPGPNFATQINSRRTSVIGTNLGTEII